MHQLLKALIFSLISISYGQEIQRGNIQFILNSKETNSYKGCLHVYEDNVLNTGKKITLNINIIPAKKRQKNKAPMFIIMGGPGQAATDKTIFFNKIFSKINEDSDLVFIDQRGTGNSNPLKFINKKNDLQNLFDDKFISKKVLKENFEILNKQNNLEKYGTFNAILDIENVRKSMGYSNINLYGTSYGTRVSIAYSNMFSKNVRTLTLKGIVPTEYIIPLNFAIDAQDIIERLIAECQNDNSCNKSFPNFNNDLKTLLNENTPIKVQLTNPQTGKLELIEIKKGVIAMSLRIIMASPSYSAHIPQLIHQAVNKNPIPLAQLILKIQQSYAKGFYEGMSLCTICFEDYPSLMKQKIDYSLIEKTFIGDYWLKRVITACNIWNPDLKLAEKVIQKKLNIPVLMISGDRDPATPPKYGKEMKKHFTNSTHLVIKNGGHSFDLMQGCVENIICDFVKNKKVKSNEIECINSISFPPFSVN